MNKGKKESFKGDEPLGKSFKKTSLYLEQTETTA